MGVPLWETQMQGGRLGEGLGEVLVRGQLAKGTSGEPPRPTLTQCNIRNRMRKPEPVTPRPYASTFPAIPLALPLVVPHQGTKPPPWPPANGGLPTRYFFRRPSSAHTREKLFARHSKVYLRKAGKPIVVRAGLRPFRLRRAVSQPEAEPSRVTGATSGGATLLEAIPRPNTRLTTQPKQPASLPGMVPYSPKERVPLPGDKPPIGKGGRPG